MSAIINASDQLFVESSEAFREYLPTRYPSNARVSCLLLGTIGMIHFHAKHVNSQMSIQSF